MSPASPAVFVPSAAGLTFNPVVSRMLDLADWPARVFIPEFARLPPNHMRVRVGAGNHLFVNQFHYLVEAKSFWISIFDRGLCTLDATIVDLGCGCGRYAQHLRDVQMGPVRFTGRYYGVDIDDEMLAWCRRNFDGERFEFLQATGRSVAYNRPGGASEPYRLPLEDESADFVFSTSLLTHLLEDDLANYLRESRRVLRRGAATLHSFFSVDHPPRSYGGRHRFSGRIGNAHVESLRQPEAAVA